MLSWGQIAYGAALSAVLGVLLVLLLGRERRPLIVATVAVGTFSGPVAWNAILRSTHANQFFTDAPIPIFPISWQDTGSGVFALAVLALLLGFGPLRASPARRVLTLTVLGTLSALLIDIYLY